MSSRRSGDFQDRNQSKRLSGVGRSHDEEELRNEDAMEYETPFFEVEEGDEGIVEGHEEDGEDEVGDDMTADGEQKVSAEDDIKFVGDFKPIEEDDDDATEESKREQQRVFRLGVDQLGDDEVLDFDPAAYAMYHKLSTEWPCLSFDILHDGLGNHRTKYPHTLYAVSGSQADASEKNVITVMKISKLGRLHHDDQDVDGVVVEGEAEDDDEVEEDPVIEYRTIKHMGAVNRIRAMPGRSDVVASWSDLGFVNIWNIEPYALALDHYIELPTNPAPLIQFDGHTDEGYALAWSKVSQGHLLSGGCDGNIFLYRLSESEIAVEDRAFKSHQGSVEDIVWSPNQDTIFASCSVDKTIRIWDTRSSKRKSALAWQAHDTDVNVIAWNEAEPISFASGSDDGEFKIWDLRQMKSDTSAPAVGRFDFHKRAITSIAWQPSEVSTLAISSEDDTVTIWDLALEADPYEVEKEKTGADLGDYDVPPQLLFQHAGQQHIKEVHFHPQIPNLIMTTAYDGMDVFRPINLNVMLAPQVADE